MKHNDILSENIKAYRNKFNLKQNELAKKLGVSRQVLSGYETGKSEPNLAFLIKLSKLMNCSIDSLLGLDENYILKFPFDSPKEPQISPSIKSNDNIYELVKSLKYLIKKNQSTYKDLSMSKKRNDRMFDELSLSKRRTDRMLEELNMSKKRNDRALKELNMSKKRFDIMFDELNRTFNRESRFNELLNELNNISENITNYTASNETYNLNTSNSIDEETSSELVPETDFNKSNYIDDENEYYDDSEEETVKVSFIPNSIAAGDPIGYLDSEVESFINLKTRYPLTKENAEEFYILTVQGDSMNRIVDDGERILVRSTSCVENGTLAVVNLVDETSSTLKYYYYDPVKRLVTLKPYSTDPTYKDMVFDADKRDIIVQGEYIGDISEFL